MTIAYRCCLYLFRFTPTFPCKSSLEKRLFDTRDLHPHNLKWLLKFVNCYQSHPALYPNYWQVRILVSKTISRKTFSTYKFCSYAKSLYEDTNPHNFNQVMKFVHGIHYTTFQPCSKCISGSSILLIAITWSIPQPDLQLFY